MVVIPYALIRIERNLVKHAYVLSWHVLPLVLQSIMLLFLEPPQGGKWKARVSRQSERGKDGVARSNPLTLPLTAFPRASSSDPPAPSSCMNELISGEQWKRVEGGGGAQVRWAKPSRQMSLCFWTL